MIHNYRNVDNVDRVHLITAMMAANQDEAQVPEGEIYIVQCPEIGEFLPLAEVALKLIAQMHRIDECNWDGVVWLGLLEEYDKGSLASMLVEFVKENDPTEEEVRPLVIAWLNGNTL